MQKIIFLCAALLFCSCVTTDGTSAKNLTQAEKQKADEMVVEIEIGRQMTGRLLAGYGTNSDKNLTSYIATLGNYVVLSSDYSGQRYLFTVTQGQGISAYSSPGGYVLISEGALKKAENEAEIAFVLAHEIAHIGKKHMLTSIRSKKPSEKNKDEELKVRERIQASGDSASGAALARYLSGPSGATISVLMAVSSGITTLLNDGLDSSLEYEADLAGLTYAMRAGYNGKAAINYLSRLNQQTKSDALLVVEKTHPSLQSRIMKLEQAYEKLKIEYPGNALGKNRFGDALASAKLTSTSNVK